jgi:ATP-dependent Lon protease
MLETIPHALRDRMEVLNLPGYTEEEKLNIARRYLFPKQVAEHGLKPDQLGITEAALLRTIREYTREAGVRNLERELAAICRAVARRVVEGELESTEVNESDVREYLGPQKFFSEVAERITAPGIATGLAWTPVGERSSLWKPPAWKGEKGCFSPGSLET